MATRAEVLRLLRFRDQLTTRDVSTILDYVDQEILTAVVLPGSVGVSEEGTPLVGAPHTVLDFVGADITATDAGSGVATITVSVAGGVTIEDEGSPIAGGPHSVLNFIGADAAVTATDAGGGQANITVAPEELFNAVTGARAGVGDFIFDTGFRVDTGSDGVVFDAAPTVLNVQSGAVNFTLPNATLTANSNGSSFSVNCGDGIGVGDGGLIQLVAGNGGVSAAGAGGNASLIGGLAGVGSAAAGGDVILQPGDADGAGVDGAVIIGTTRVGDLAGELRFIEDGNTTPTYGSYVGLKARAVVTVASQIYILPEGGQTNNMVLGIDLGEFTVAGLPSATANANCSALATNASGGRTLVRSDGTNWKVVVVEGATVSV
jgi:hypothetical protein